jgi:hypothetical protein
MIGDLNSPPVVLLLTMTLYWKTVQSKKTVMYQLEKVSSSEALLLTEGVIGEANKIAKHIAAAVCGPEGELISFFKDGWCESGGIEDCAEQGLHGSR